MPRSALIPVARLVARAFGLALVCGLAVASGATRAATASLSPASSGPGALPTTASHAQDRPAPVVEPSPAPEPALLRLGDLLARPQRHLGTRIRIDLQWDGIEPHWKPYVSRFAPSEFACLRAWADEAHLWREAEHERPFRRLYARRGGAFERLLATSPRYKRWRLELEVREVLLGQPWMEIVGAVPLPDSVGEGALIHAARADELAHEGRWELARSNYERALAGLLPAHQRAELERLRDECTLALGAEALTR